ncbi:GAF and ANTAR domain-containing protein [Georgenia satyanarayanai]|uniref:GAF and ANTAR domain-containing protein n=1 Tax=Georgenia satyanarayanai TaxID=860221 RepID=UPI00126402DB|nr:GAF and ANTAR domain-containing protein [Georgenia satyanarayanai]
MTEPVSGQLAPAVARSSGMLLADQAVDAVLPLLTAAVLHTVPVASGAGITLTADDGSPTTAAGTDPVVTSADALQYELDEGPCLTAWREQRSVRVDDVTAETRWPRWTSAVAGLGLRSVLSTPLVAGSATVGALKLYSRDTRAFSSTDETTAKLLAAQAAILVSSARRFRRAGEIGEEVQALLAQRDAVTRATGFVMGRDHVPEDVAFAHLVSLARSEGRSVHATAQRLLSSPRAAR